MEIWSIEDNINGDCLCSNRATNEGLPMIERPIPSHPSAKCERGIYMTVTWNEPNKKNTADITGYVIKYGSIGQRDHNYRIQNVNKTTTEFQFTDQLDEDTRYRFAVAAVNATGQGKFSKYTKFVRTKSGEHCCYYHCSFRTCTYFLYRRLLRATLHSHANVVYYYYFSPTSTKP